MFSLFFLRRGSQRTGWNRFFNPSFGGFRSISSGKLFTTYFAKTSWDRALRFAEHWMSHLSDQQHRRKVNHLDLQSTILRFMLNSEKVSKDGQRSGDSNGSVKRDSMGSFEERLQRRSFEMRLRQRTSKEVFKGWIRRRVSKWVSEEVFEVDFEGKVRRRGFEGEASGLRRRSSKSGIQRAASKEQTLQTLRTGLRCLFGEQRHGNAHLNTFPIAGARDSNKGRSTYRTSSVRTRAQSGCDGIAVF